MIFGCRRRARPRLRVVEGRIRVVAFPHLTFKQNATDNYNPFERLNILGLEGFNILFTLVYWKVFSVKR